MAMKESEFLEKLAEAEYNIANLMERQEVVGWERVGHEASCMSRCRGDAFMVASLRALEMEKQNGET